MIEETWASMVCQAHEPALIQEQTMISDEHLVLLVVVVVVVAGCNAGLVERAEGSFLRRHTGGAQQMVVAGVRLRQRMIGWNVQRGCCAGASWPTWLLYLPAFGIHLKICRWDHKDSSGEHKVRGGGGVSCSAWLLYGCPSVRLPVHDWLECSVWLLYWTTYVRACRQLPTLVSCALGTVLVGKLRTGAWTPTH